MTEEQVKEYLKNRGCPEFIWQGGSAGLIRRWQEFVTDVEEGNYSNCSVEEYWNDLDLRELIHDIAFDSDVKESDERFAAILTLTTIKHWHADRNTEYDFWNYGYPKNATGYFLEDIKRHFVRLGISINATT